MKTCSAVFTALVWLFAATSARALPSWEEGKHYFRINSSRYTALPADTIEVLEVFSYGCPACYQFKPTAQRIKASLPKNARLAYLPASFIAAENWPAFQRAFLTAEALGVVEQTHDAMLDAVWKTGEIAVWEANTRRPKQTLPSIDDIARVYNHIAGVDVTRFTAAAKSPAIDAKMKAADKQILAYEVDRTPTLIVNGKYRVTAESAGGYDRMVELVQWLVEKESRALSVARKPSS